MRTVRFKEVLEWLARRMLGSAAAMQEADAAAYVDAINTAVRAGWEFAFWPEWTVVEERFFRAAWQNATTYTTGAEVYYSGAYYRAVASSTNVTPGTDATKWEVCGVDGALPLRAYVSLDQTGETPIGEVDDVFSADPRLCETAAKSMGWRLGADGIELAACGSAQLPVSVWVRFRLRPPVFTSELWDDDADYVTGARVYEPNSGECYVALVDSPSPMPGTDATRWQRLTFPYVIAEAVKQLAYADALKDDGQVDKANDEKRDGEEQLAIEWLKVAPNGQSTRKRA